MFLKVKLARMKKSLFSWSCVSIVSIILSISIILVFKFGGSLFSKTSEDLIILPPGKIVEAAQEWKHFYKLRAPDSIGIPKCRVFVQSQMALIKPKVEQIIRNDRRRAPKVLFFVNSAIKNFERREKLRFMFDLLREFIQKEFDINEISFSTVFVVGSSQNLTINEMLSFETKNYEDILMTHVEDSYETLALKTFFSFQVSLFTMPIRQLSAFTFFFIYNF